jgi:hypothetical protein
MKKLAITLICLLSTSYMYAQQAESETIIRKLEETERQAVLKQDTATLQKIWSSALIVNAPSNRVVLSTGRVADRPVVAKPRYSVFTREIEQLLIKGDIVFSMGNEVVVPVGDDPKAGRSVKRRYTNIWIKENGNWKLAARHANEICEP